MTAELDPLSELRFLTEALRAHAEWQQACGAAALPSESWQSTVGSSQPQELRSAPAVAQPVLAQPLAAAAASAPKLPIANYQLPTSAERQARLALLADETRACTRCALHLERKQAVFARGNGSSGLCFVGEGPGADEDEQGAPFVGAAGQLLDRMIAAMGIERDDVYVCNIVKCRPPKNRTPEPEEMSACMPYLTEQLALVEPQVIVALGKTAVQGLFGTAEGITRIRGRWRLYQGKVAVMPTFHPAYLLRNPAAKREVWADLQLVLKHLGRVVPGKGA
jgi:DNA polymerase